MTRIQMSRTFKWKCITEIIKIICYLFFQFIGRGGTGGFGEGTDGLVVLVVREDLVSGQFIDGGIGGDRIEGDSLILVVFGIDSDEGSVGKGKVGDISSLLGSGARCDDCFCSVVSLAAGWDESNDPGAFSELRRGSMRTRYEAYSVLGFYGHQKIVNNPFTFLNPAESLKWWGRDGGR